MAVLKQPARLAGTSLTLTGLSAVLELRVIRRELDGAVVVEARLRSPDGQPRRAGEMEAVLHRATHARADRPVAFTPQADTAWRAVIHPSGGGAWELAVQARGDAGAASATLRL